MRDYARVTEDLKKILGITATDKKVAKVIDYFDHINVKKLTKEEVAEIRHCYEMESFSQERLAEIYGVNPATISRTVRGIYHKEV